MKNLLKKLAPLFLVAFASTGAHATYDYGYWFFKNYADVKADPGTYKPISLGDDLTVNFCNSNVVDASSQSVLASVCSFNELQYFTVTWSLIRNSATVLTKTFSAQNNTSFTFRTGVGTALNVAGTYTLALTINVRNYSFIKVPNSKWYNTAGDTGSANARENGFTNTGYATTSLTINKAAVPEPAAALLLLPVFALAATRRRKQKHA